VSGPAPMRAAVGIVTLNRAASLERALCSLADQDLAPDCFEVIVVDGGSTDGTADVVDAARRSGLPVRLVTETRPGVAAARNRALDEAVAPVLAFLDDDETACPAWARALVSTLEGSPAAVAAGGPIVPVWPDGRPGWVSPFFVGYFGSTDLGEAPVAYPESGYPYSGNAAVRVEAARAAGGFVPGFGRSHRTLLSNEEKEFFSRLRERGGLLYAPAAAVHHHVDAARVSRRWALRRAFAQGRSDVLLLRLAYGNESRRAWTREGGRALYHAAGRPVRAAGKGRGAVDTAGRMSYWMGRALEAWRLAGAPARAPTARSTDGRRATGSAARDPSGR
jgi:glucosyl-dolichyl phosphate glucuronosyltransferase